MIKPDLLWTLIDSLIVYHTAEEGPCAPTDLVDAAGANNIGKRE